MNDHYIPDDAYQALVTALLNLPTCPATGEPADYHIHEALGEIGNVWPASVQQTIDIDHAATVA